MDVISRKYTGKPFPFRDPQGRVALVIEVDKARYAKLPFEHTPPKASTPSSSPVAIAARAAAGRRQAPKCSWYSS